MRPQIHCPLHDPSQCRLNVSLELSGGRGLVQATCAACGHGQSLALPRDQAEELLQELHAHREPPAAPEAATATPASIASIVPTPA